MHALHICFLLFDRKLLPELTLQIPANKKEKQLKKTMHDVPSNLFANIFDSSRIAYILISNISKHETQFNKQTIAGMFI